MKIQSIDAYQIFDSRGKPTLEVELILEDGSVGYGLVPSGASTGQFEALELRDGNPKLFKGQSVYKAIENVKKILGPELKGMPIDDQGAIDTRMCALDGSLDKSNLGANTILGISMAVTNAAAKSLRIPLYRYLASLYHKKYCKSLETSKIKTLLPLPEIQLVGGGAHAQWRTDIQDFLLIVNRAQSYQEALAVTYEVYHCGQELLKDRKRLFGAADEGGFWPAFDSHEEIFDFVVEAITAAGYQHGADVSISLDIAASDLYRNGSYHLRLENKSYTSTEFYDLLSHWCSKYPVLSIEDPFSDTDFEMWKRMKRDFGTKLQIVGDDLFTTNLERIQNGIEKGMANSVLIKLNQIGTVSETLQAIRQTQEAGWLPVISARSGETEDAFISHLAVGTDAGQLKVGSFSRSERMVKWNEILRIERDILRETGEQAPFIGAKIYERLLTI